MKVAIVGAGIAGLACATRLKQRGIEPELFDKGRRPGGRLSTLRLGSWAWDFGCPYLTRGEGAFAAQVDQWQRAGLLVPWLEGPAGALVGVPAMASLVEGQERDLCVHYQAQVQRLERAGSDWFVGGPDLRAGPFAAVGLAVPAEQAAPLLSLHDLEMAREAAAVRSQPCWAVMAGFPERLPLPAYLHERGMIAWAARENSKPGRGNAECWVIQAGPEWSRANLEREREDVARQILSLFAAELGISLPPPEFLKAHRWRFALSYGQSGRTLWNSPLRLGACGDWCLSGHVEGAWLAGVDLADRMICALRGDRAKPALSNAR